MLFLTFSALVANPKKLLYAVANPARGLLNRGKKKEEKIWQATTIIIQVDRGCCRNGGRRFVIACTLQLENVESLDDFVGWAGQHIRQRLFLCIIACNLDSELLSVACQPGGSVVNLKTFRRWDVSSNLDAATRTGIVSHIMPNKWRTIAVCRGYTKFDFTVDEGTLKRAPQEKIKERQRKLLCGIPPV